MTRVRLCVPAIVLLLGMSWPVTASAQTQYNFVGVPFTSWMGAQCPPICHIFGSVTFASPLPPNMLCDIGGSGCVTPITFSFTDGETVFTEQNTYLSGFSFDTDTNANITYYSFYTAPPPNGGAGFGVYYGGGDELTTEVTNMLQYEAVFEQLGAYGGCWWLGNLSTCGVATTTSVSSAPNPSTYGDSVTVTAIVSPFGPPAPTGFVNFTSNGSAISGCTFLPLTSGIAACTTSGLASGTDTIAATYYGDGIYAGSVGSVTQIVNPYPIPTAFSTITPCRIVDTRNPDGTFGGPYMAARTIRSFPLAQAGNQCNIPPNATAYSLNVTVVPQSILRYLTIWPTGEGQPIVSTLNSPDGRIKAVAAIVPAGTPDGSVSVYVTDATNVIIDIGGYFTSNGGQMEGSGSLAFYPITPCRVADTRDANGPLGGPFLGGGQQRNFPVLQSSCGLPDSAAAYSFNFTAIPKTSAGLSYLTVWPQGQSMPNVSTLNDRVDTVVANAALVPAGDQGGISVYATNDTDLVIDANGYFAPMGTGGLSFYQLTPCRVADTRQLGNGQPFAGELTVNVVGSPCGPTNTAQGYVFSATVVPRGALGYLTLWPDSEQQPGVSTLNAPDGAVTSNMAIVPNLNGKTDAWAQGTTQLILDISGYFAP